MKPLAALLLLGLAACGGTTGSSPQLRADEACKFETNDIYERELFRSCMARKGALPT